MYDVTTGSEVALDATIFTFDDSLYPAAKLQFSTTNPAAQGVYTIRLKVYYSGYMAETVTNRDFLVEIVDQCTSAVLTIGTSILLAPPAVTLTEIIGQTTAAVTWTSSIVSTSITGTDPCGSISEEVWDVTSGSEVALDTSKFALDTATANSYTLSVATTNVVDVGTYTLRFKAYYASYAA